MTPEIQLDPSVTSGLVVLGEWQFWRGKMIVFRWKEGLRERWGRGQGLEVTTRGAQAQRHPFVGTELPCLFCRVVGWAAVTGTGGR